jgi:hypothetical protein
VQSRLLQVVQDVIQLRNQAYIYKIVYIWKPYKDYFSMLGKQRFVYTKSLAYAR